MNKLFIGIYLIGFLCQISLGQEVNYKNYSVHDGVPSNQVYKIIQDDLGYLWFLTDMGVSRFDGYAFKNYDTSDGLTDNVFFDAQKTSDGLIWLLAKNGTVTKISGSEPSFIPYAFNDTLVKYGNTNTPKKVYVMDDRILVAYMYSAEYLEVSDKGKVLNEPDAIDRSLRYYQVLFDDHFFYHSLHKPTGNNRKHSPNKVEVYYEDFGFTLPGTNASVFISTRDKITIDFPQREPIYLHDENILLSGLLDDYTLWVSSRSGGVKIYSFDGQLRGQFLQNAIVTDVFFDSEGSHWFSTIYNGVYRETNFGIKKYDLGNEVNNGINKIVRNDSSDLYIAHLNGNVSKISNGKLLSLYESTRKTPATVSIVDDQAIFYSDLWLHSIVEDKPIKKAETGFVSELYQDFTNQIVVFNGDHYSILSPQYLKNNTIYTGTRVNNIVDYEGEKWIASEKGLLMQVENSNEISVSSNDLYKKRINDLICFNDLLILGTHGEGLIVIYEDAIIGKIQNEDLASNFVKNLYAENDSTLWVGTNSGLTRLIVNEDFSQFESQSVNHEQGLLCNSVSTIAVINDTVWVGSEDGLYFMNKSYFNQVDRSFNYHLKINEFLVNDSPVDAIDNNRFSYYENRLTLRFSCISFKLGDKIEYRYRLGNEGEWIYSKNRYAQYSNLAPGEYVFTVQVKGENESWEEQSTQIRFTILPPFWRQWWFIIAITLLIALLIYAFFRFKIFIYNKDLTREILRHLLKKVRKDDPHILVKEGQRQVKIYSREIMYVKSDGNYIEIHHDKGKTVIREKISQFLKIVPDPIEYIQVRRSYIVRIDRIEQRGKKEIVVNGQKIVVGSTFEKEIKKIEL